MYKLELTNKFKKDIKLAKKRNLNMELIDFVVTKLVENGKLEAKYKPHTLKGDYMGMPYTTRLVINLGTK